ncbi:hypothetical protein JCM8202v2_002527 [Rhodotorula sphaerocarpa]
MAGPTRNQIPSYPTFVNGRGERQVVGRPQMPDSCTTRLAVAGIHRDRLWTRSCQGKLPSATATRSSSYSNAGPASFAQPVFPTPNASSPTDALQTPSTYGYDPQTPSPRSGAYATLQGSPSPSPSRHAEGPRSSVLDRPRPKTPDPFDSNVRPLEVPQDLPPRVVAPRPSAPAALPSFATSPVFPSRPQAGRKSSSVLDRPRPKTPEMLAGYRLPSPSSSAVSPAADVRPESTFSSEPSSGSTTPTMTPVFPSKPRSSVLDRPRPRTPEPAAALGEASTNMPSGVSPVERGDSPGLGATGAAESPASDAVLDKSPRNAGLTINTATKTSVLDRPRPKTPDALSWLHGTGRSPVGPLHRANDSTATTTTALSSSQSGSFDSHGPYSSRDFTASTPTSTVSSLPPSLESNQKEPPDSVRSPLLKLDFDFGSTFGTTETMFGLSDYLKNGGGESASTGGAAPSSNRLVPAPPASGQAAASPPPRSSSLEPLSSSKREAVDPIASEAEHTGAARGAQDEPASQATSRDEAASSIKSARDVDGLSRSDTLSKSTSTASTPEASPDRPKRKRRKSLASLLSFRSNSQSVDESHGAPLASGATAAASSYERSTSLSGTDEVGLESVHADGPTTRDYEADSPLGHQPTGPQHLHVQQPNSVDSSPEDTRRGGRSSAFRVISATTSRKPSRAASGSISSLKTNETDSSSRRRQPSLDLGRLSARTPSSDYRGPPGVPPSPAAPIGRPFGKRLVERLTRGSSRSNAAPEALADTWSAPVKDHSAQEATPRPGLGRRRGSFSSLLGLKSEKDPSESSRNGPKKLLGMSLPAGRRSEDLLTSGRSKPDAFSEVARARQRRRSVDLVAENLPRKSVSSEDLLIITPRRSLHRSEEAPHELEQPRASFESGPGSLQISEAPTSPTVAATMTDDSHEADRSAAVITMAQRVDVSRSASMPFVDANAEAPEKEPPPAAAPADGAANASPEPEEVSKPPPNLVIPPLLHPKKPAQPIPAALPLWRQQRRRISATVPTTQQTTMTSGWMAVEEAVGSYEHLLREGRVDRGAIISTVLLPFLRQEESQGRTHLSKRLAKRQREVLFHWVDVMTRELKRLQPTHRGALLEAVATILESHNLSIASLGDDRVDQARFRSTIVHVLDFAIEKLNDKAVFANTLVFSGRILAIAFFRVDGVALKLIRALPPVKRQTLRRILQEAGADESNLPEIDRESYPPHLFPLCLRSFRDYAEQVLSPRGAPSELDNVLVHDGDVRIEMSGNWLIRWTASDSDLPFSFYRAYFRQLSSVLVPFELRAATASEPCLGAVHVVTAPGFLFVAASLLDKSDALVHRNLRSVTSIGHPNSNFDTNDSANLSFGQKPKVLELAQRRVTTTMLDIVGGRHAGSKAVSEAAPDAAARRYLFGTMLQVWIRATVKRTSMWDQRGVFLLLDLLEGLIYTLAHTAAPMSTIPGQERPDPTSLDLLDVPFVFDFLRRILAEADNTVTIMRTIAFIYSHFEILTQRSQDRTELCERVILDEALFQRLFLHWNSGCRGFFIRLLVWRVARLGALDREWDPHYVPEPSVVNIFNLLNVRLEAVRKRHEQLEPADNLSVPEDAFFRPKRSTICSTRGVKEAPWALEEGSDEGPAIVEPIAAATSALEASSTKAERLTAAEVKPAKNDKTAVSKVVSWLRGGQKQKSGRAEKPKPLSLSSKSRSSQEWPTAPLPTKVETGKVQAGGDKGDRPTSQQNGLPKPSPPALVRRGSSSSSSTKSERRRSPGSAYFAFGYENGVVSRADVDSNLLAAVEPDSISPPASGSPSPTRARSGDRSAALSPRVSMRFSKRSSILPPAALDLLKSTGVDDVPPIPERFRRTIETGYDKRLHPYAIRGLRDYEDALDEWTEWVAHLQQQEEEVPTTFDLVPRLAVNWPLNSEDG